MKIKELIERLRTYNAWRRGAENEMPEPQQIGQDIDAAIAAITALETRIAELTEELIEELEEVVEFAPECTSSKEYAEKRLKELKGGGA